MSRIITSTRYCSVITVLLAAIGLCFTKSNPKGLYQNDILQFNPPSIEPTIDPNSICRDFPELNKRQSSMCNRYPHATASAMQGLLLAIHECQRQFEGHRWNCSNLDSFIANDHPFVNRGFKETAFTHAMTSAGVLHQVATSCSMGKISSCRCKKDASARPDDDDEFLWRGCSHDLSYGAKFARRFLNQKEKGVQTIHSMMQAHNSKVGRKAVMNQKSTKCKCHGMSSSCEVKTCWLAAPDLKDVGDKLKDLYENSVKVDRTNSVKGRIVPTRVFDNNYVNQQKHSTKKLKKQMVYYENSPTYCDNMKEINSYGTSGRVCNKTANAIDSCSSLCCGRGFFTVRIHKIEKCNCRFHWCCYVECQKCEFDEWVTVCK